MNPQNDQTPGLHLPQPSEGVLPPMPPVPYAGVTPQAAIQFTAAQQPQQQPLPTALPPVPLDASGEESDTGLDEEWVNKAREVVSRTKMDPYAQSRELSRVKAQYIKSRYSKEIKFSEDRP